jgi:hypothetical protein
MREDWSDLATFQAGSVLSVAWRTLFRAPGVFIGLAFVSFLVTTISVIGFDSLVRDDNSAITTLVFVWIPPMIGLIMSAVIQGAIAYAVFQVIMGGRASVGESVSRSVSKILALLAVAVLSGLGVGFAGILLLFPGIIVQCMWYVAASACVVERLGPIESLGRSRALTKGYRWQVFGVMALTFLMILLVNILFGFLVRVFTPPDMALRNAITQIVTGLATLIPNAFVSVVAAVTYYRLRMVKESMTMESLADVFD